MRSTDIRRSVLLGAALLGATSGASADDSLFLPSYQRMGLVPGSAAPAPAPAPPTLAPPTPVPPSPAPATPTAQPIPAGRPRLTTWPNQVLAHSHHQHQAQAAPAAPAAFRTRLGLRGPAPVEPVPPIAAPPASGPTVAATLSDRAIDAPASVAPGSRGLLARLRKAEPLVPPGRPRGSQPAEMVPPEPLGPDPLMADLAGAAARRSADLDRVEAAAGLPPQPALAARPDVAGTSPFAPVSARDRLGLSDRVAEAPARRSSRSIPPLIARPTEPEADSPLRQVRASDADLEPQAAPIVNGPNY